MGVDVAGIGFRSKDIDQAIDELSSTLFKRPCRQIAQPNQREFNIRHPSDIMVEFFDDVCFIYSNELVCDILENPGADTSHIFATLNRPELIPGFCNYESGGSYGLSNAASGRRESPGGGVSLTSHMLYEALVKSSSLWRKSFRRGEDICRQVLQRCAPRFRNRQL